MNKKIEKLLNERQKNLDKIAELEARNQELNRQIREMENAEIIGLVRSEGYTLEELAHLLEQRRNQTQNQEGMDQPW